MTLFILLLILICLMFGTTGVGFFLAGCVIVIITIFLIAISPDKKVSKDNETK